MAPLAVSVEVAPIHIVDCNVDAVTVGIPFAVIITTSDPKQPLASVTDKVYVVAPAIDVVNIGALMELFDKFVLGFHVYLYGAPPPVIDAFMAMFVLIQADMSVPALTVGTELTVMVCVAVPVHPPVADVLVIVYFVFVVGVIVIEAVDEPVLHK